MQQSAANPQLQSNRHGGREFESQLTRGKVTATTRTRFNFFAADRSQPRTLVQSNPVQLVDGKSSQDYFGYLLAAVAQIPKRMTQLEVGGRGSAITIGM